jgi:ketosteroid isomerase-like protein
MIIDPEDFTALDPFFMIIEKGWRGSSTAGTSSTCWTRTSSWGASSASPTIRVAWWARGRGRALSQPRATGIVLHSADELAGHRDREASVVVLEYATHGRVTDTGRAYDNRFVSVITVKDCKVTHWRDYLNPVAVFDALGWPPPRR